MAKYLIEARYTSEGAKGVLKEGGTGRRKAVEELLRSIDGKVEAFYFAFGKRDAYVLFDAPDNVSAAALAMVIGASGMVESKTTVLLTPEEVDRAAKKAVTYRAPGK